MESLLKSGSIKSPKFGNSKENSPNEKDPGEESNTPRFQSKYTLPKWRLIYLTIIWDHYSDSEEKANCLYNVIKAIQQSQLRRNQKATRQRELVRTMLKELIFLSVLHHEEPPSFNETSDGSGSLDLRGP